MNAALEERIVPHEEELGATRADVITGRASGAKRWRVMARVAIHMMLHDKLKMLGTLTGVIFAVVLSNQQAGVFLGLMQKNAMFVENAGADLWIVPKNTESLQPAKPMSDSVLMRAKAAEGVSWAEPLLWGTGSLSLPGGGTEAVQIIGTRAPAFRGGPWNLVSGDEKVLLRPDTMIFEDSEREMLGKLNLGSVREVNGHRVVAGGFTWGLIPFGPSFSFAEYDLARLLLGMDRDRVSYVLVGVAPGADLKKVQASLQSALPDARVFEKKEFRRSIIGYVLTKTAIGITFATSTLFGLLVGFVIVALSMFSAVVDNVREFGTLKAIGATTGDLTRLMLVQSVVFGAAGALIGLALVSRVAEGIRSAKLAMQLPPELLIVTAVVMIVMCGLASSLALLRLRQVEPAMVFR
jgi:putative ABC transport system permease protein